MTKAPQKKAPVKKTDASTKDPETKGLATDMPLSEKDEVKQAEDKTNHPSGKGVN